jgi:hypothetical protein
MQNTQKFFEEYMRMYGDNPEKYNSQPPAPNPMEAMAGTPQAQMNEGLPMEASGVNQEVPQMGKLPAVA